VTTVRNSVIWGAIVGVALGVTITFGLARGMLPMPWRAETPVEASGIGPKGPPQEASRSAVLDLESLSTIVPVVQADLLRGVPSSGAEHRGDDSGPRRAARPAAERPGDASLAAAVPATTTVERGLSRS